jgi:L-threonylcarbamoyladenylate synthase
MSARIVDARTDAHAIAEAAAILRRGGLVALPTETVYGLAARALDPDALERVFVAKGRPATHPLIAHVLDLEGARAVAADVEPARALAAAFWPGPLSLVLPRAAAAPAQLSGGLPTVAVRAPSHPVMRAVIAALGEPVAAPSANRYQQVSPTTAAHVARGLGDVVELILDGGACDSGIESTVVDLTGPPRILRPGPIGEAALRRVLPEIRTGTAEVAAGLPRVSPGLDARHYAPRAEARRFNGPPPASAGDGVIFCGPPHGVPAGVRAIALPHDALAYAAGFYAALHTLDDANCPYIYIEDVPGEPEWAAIADRIQRATTAAAP